MSPWKACFVKTENMHIGVDLWCLIPNLMDLQAVQSPVFSWSAVYFVNMHIGVDLWCLIPNLMDLQAVQSPVFSWSAVYFVNPTVSTVILTKPLKSWMWTGMHARNVH